MVIKFRKFLKEKYYVLLQIMEIILSLICDFYDRRGKKIYESGFS